MVDVSGEGRDRAHRPRQRPRPGLAPRGRAAARRGSAQGRRPRHRAHRGHHGRQAHPGPDPALPPAGGVRRELDLSVADDAVEILATVKTTDRTGVEMEALTAVSVAALTVIDMVKAVDKGAVITDVRVEEKTGGKSGDWTRQRTAAGHEPLPRPGRHRLQPRRRRGLRGHGRPPDREGPAQPSASQVDGPQVVPDGDPVEAGAAGRGRRRVRRHPHHRRHRHLAHRPHPRGHPQRARPRGARHPRGHPRVRTREGARRPRSPGASPASRDAR